MPRVLYISMLCEEGSTEFTSTCGAAEGVNDGVWLETRIKEAGLSGTYSVTHMCISRGNQPLPTLDETSSFDCIVIGGTFHNVYENRPWQMPLKDWLLNYRKTGRPLFGICGGHQAMCVALGGEVTKRPAGTVGGTYPVILTQDGAKHDVFKGKTQSISQLTFLLRYSMVTSFRCAYPTNCPSMKPAPRIPIDPLNLQRVSNII